ncbi:ABC transporter ATP-binding protein [Acidimicrobium ferrooxidans]|uniref:ABC transporter ATP-binding protein n=1 Tax=Acidimicrobium ferrooxidans TaxID=53635 RepID=A0ABS3AS22_9ACTN|nr:ABC transporter ATP-binding protein [Acidimicrobium ferrooxidans]
MTQTIETKPAHDDSASICFDQVSKWFRRKGQVVHALSRVSLDIADGEFVSFIGPSGCGKSTLLRLAGGLLEPDRGTIDVKGETPNTARRLKHYSFIPQHPALLPWRTVRRNVSMLGEVNRRASTAGISAEAQLALLDQIGLGSFIDSYPKELSGGMQQRVSIARAFALDAPVMLMDEPFSALDEITRSEIRYLLLDLWSQARSTVLFVTHSIPEAVVMSDRVIVLGARPGRVTDIINVDLPRPRHEAVENSDRYHYLVNEVRVALRKGSS